MALAGVLRTLFCVLCWFMLAAAVVYLGVAGMNYALISAAQIPEELRGTRILLIYSAVQAVLFAAAGVMGLVGIVRTDNQRYLRLAPCAPAVLTIAAEATQMFNMGDHILDNRFIFGANFFFGILAILAVALAAAGLYLFGKHDDGRMPRYGAVVTFDTDPVAASQAPLPAVSVDVDPLHGSAQGLMQDAALDDGAEALPALGGMGASMSSRTLRMKMRPMRRQAAAVKTMMKKWRVPTAPISSKRFAGEKQQTDRGETIHGKGYHRREAGITGAVQAV